MQNEVEPLARGRNRPIVEDGMKENDTDEDRLSSAVFEARYLEQIPGRTWYVAVFLYAKIFIKLQITVNSTTLTGAVTAVCSTSRDRQ